jgi:CRP-like cAMP-binding protein
MLRHVARRWADAEHPTLAPAEATRAGTSADPAALVARMRLLSGSDLLGSLRAHTLGRLAKEMQEYRLRAGASLWETDACSDDCFVLVEGRLCVEGLSDDLQAPGTVVGLGEALARTAPRRAVVAEAGARLLRLSSEVLIDELEDDPDTATALLGALARHVLRVESAVVRP